MDGAAGVTQCPVAPGGQFVYNVTIPSDQSGTFWYHAHSGLSRADGLYGGFVVHAPASRSTVRGLMVRNRGDAHLYGYQKELLLLIGDWYHRPASDILDWYKLPGNFGNEVCSKFKNSGDAILISDFCLAGARFSSHQWGRPVQLLDGSPCPPRGLYRSASRSFIFGSRSGHYISDPCSKHRVWIRRNSFMKLATDIKQGSGRTQS